MAKKKRLFLREPPDEARVERAIAALSAIPGVLSVFLGAPAREGRRYVRGYALCVRVVRKRDGEGEADFQPIPPLVEGIPTDVEAVGLPSAQALQAGQPAGARPLEAADRRTPGALTAILPDGQALLSGHACLPFRGGRIVRRFDGGPAPIRAGDALGQLSGGSIGAREDWASATFVAAIEAVHPIPGRPPPFPCAGVRAGAMLRHLSPQRGLSRGRVTSAGANVPIPLQLPDGTIHRYEGTIEVEPIGAPAFSAPGDSGSLVFDGLGRAVGVVVGGSEGLERTYVLPVAVEAPFFEG